MNYPGDVVECISDEKPGFYHGDWLAIDNIKKGDRLEVESISSGSGWQWGVKFVGKKYRQSARLFKLVKPDNAIEVAVPESSARFDAAMKFLETSGDVVQALKIAAGVQ